MNSRRLLLAAIFATTAAIGASAVGLAAPPDAHAQAAALLSRPQTPGSSYAHELAPGYSSSLTTADAHAHAAALLSGVRRTHGTNTKANVTPSAVALDAHAQAAALLKGSRITARTSPISKNGEPLGQHPAVLVAQEWSTRGIDPNAFIVAHPARLELIAAPPSDKDGIMATRQ